MIKAQIIIEMKDGALYTYANHFLEEKDDVVDRKGNYTFKGEPGKYYMYTGEDGDEYKDQNEPGMAKADYEYLLKDVKKETGYLTFPEANGLPAFSNGTLDEIEIPRDKEVGNTKAFTRTKLPRDFVKTIKLVETVVPYPFGRPKEDVLLKAPKTEELYSIPREIKTTYERYVSLPVVKDGVITNFDDFDTVYFRKPKTEQWIEVEGSTVNFECELVGEVNGIKGGISYYRAL